MAQEPVLMEKVRFTHNNSFRMLYKQNATRRAREALELELTAGESWKPGRSCLVEPVFDMKFSSRWECE